MTVRGDLWVVCMDCTPICDTFPTKGRRVSSQIFLTSPSSPCAPMDRTDVRVLGVIFLPSFYRVFTCRSEVLVLGYGHLCSRRIVLLLLASSSSLLVCILSYTSHPIMLRPYIRQHSRLCYVHMPLPYPSLHISQS